MDAEMEAILSGVDEGLVIFSLGTVSNTTNMPSSMIVIKCFFSMRAELFCRSLRSLSASHHSLEDGEEDRGSGEALQSPSSQMASTKGTYE